MALTSQPTARAALWSAHTAALLFGLVGILAAMVSANPWVITAGRSGFAAAAIALFALFTRHSLWGQMNARGLGVLVLTGIWLASHWVTFFYAVKIGGVAMATLGFASFPAFIAVMDHFLFKDRMGARESLLLGLISLGLILVTPSLDLRNEGTAGLLWGIASGLSFAVLAIINKRSRTGADALQAAFWQNVVVLLLMLPIAHDFSSITGKEWLFLALLGVFCTGLSQYLFVHSLHGMSARSVGMIIALEPVYAIAFAWWLFSEQPSVRMLCGAALIIISTWTSSMGGRKK